MSKLILASNSPRRKELLALLQHPFQVISANIDESFAQNLTPQQIVEQLSFKKALAIAEQSEDATVIGADTIVVFHNEILGKPKNYDEAIAMLTKLSDNTHHVFTGVTIINKKYNLTKTFIEKTEVSFWNLTTDEIENYVSTGEPFDKAGGYGIQQLGATLVHKINGDYYNVVGLPVGRLKRELEKFPI